MSTSALEFVAPLNVGGTNFNRNPRKFHILQMDFGEGLVPVLVGTYGVDPTTGQAIQSPPPLNYFSKFAVSALSNVVPAVPGKQITFYWGKISTTTPAANTVELFWANDNTGSAASTFSSDYITETSTDGGTIIADFRPTGIPLGVGKGLYVNYTAGGNTVDVYGGYTQQ